MKKPLFETEDLDDTNRAEYRLYPTPEDNLSLYIAGKKVEIINLSGTGLAFKFAGKVKEATYKIKLQFGLQQTHQVKCSIKILHMNPPIYSGALVDLSIHDSKLIGQIIINSQKRAIRRGSSDE